MHPTLAISLIFATSSVAQARQAPADPAELAALRAGVEEWRAPAPPPAGSTDLRRRDAWADVALAAEWVRRALALDEVATKEDLAAAKQLLDLGRERQGQFDAGDPAWAQAEGTVVRGFVSAVDGTIQPYAVEVPAGGTREGAGPFRLDVVLHGRNDKLNEVRFFRSHRGKPASHQDRITLHVFGRGNNAYRWAGETDVFEAIAAAKRQYPIDPDRIVLRGFSMGGAGAWHIGLHHPRLWSSAEAGAGFSESIRYAKLKDLPETQRLGLAIYDAADYALNAVNVPIAGYGGEKDPQLQASENIVRALEGLGFSMRTEGLTTRGVDIPFLRVIGAGMGHKVDPASAEILEEFHRRHLGITRDAARGVRFVTYTLKYADAGSFRLKGLGRHYERSTVEIEPKEGVAVVRTANVTELEFRMPIAPTLEIDGQSFPAGGEARAFHRRAEGWAPGERPRADGSRPRKGPGLQGPIDDAFAGSFLCVRGTGEPWDPHVARWADARLHRFRSDWRRWMRGEARVKQDIAVTPEDIRDHHLILFGDPGSNRWIAEVLGRLPLRWTRAELGLGGSTYPSSDHAPVLIAPNPLNPARYVVLNSGQTFGREDFTKTNALLFPKLGDYAAFRIGSGDGEVVSTGFFDEEWSAGGGAP